jgi:hypothetical protein
MLSRIFDSERATVPAEPGGRQEAGEQQGPAGQFESTLGADHAVDVVTVALAEVGHGPAPEVVELGGRGPRPARG